MTVSFRFLHDGLLRTLLARIGSIGKNAPDYWKYGCYFRTQDSKIRVRFDSTTTPEGPSAAGSITFSAWGEQGQRNPSEPAGGGGTSDTRTTVASRLVPLHGTGGAGPSSSRPSSSVGAHRFRLHTAPAFRKQRRMAARSTCWT